MGCGIPKEEFLFSGCLCCYHTCEINSGFPGLICCTQEYEKCCFAGENCCALKGDKSIENPLPVHFKTSGIDDDKLENELMCQIALYCCTCGFKIPVICCKFKTACLFCKGVGAVPWVDEYVTDYVCALCGYRLWPKPMGCTKPPPGMLGAAGAPPAMSPAMER